MREVGEPLLFFVDIKCADGVVRHSPEHDFGGVRARAGVEREHVVAGTEEYFAAVVVELGMAHPFDAAQLNRRRLRLPPVPLELPPLGPPVGHPVVDVVAHQSAAPLEADDVEVAQAVHDPVGDAVHSQTVGGREEEREVLVGRSHLELRSIHDSKRRDDSPQAVINESQHRSREESRAF